jgi:hypothetical protein
VVPRYHSLWGLVLLSVIVGSVCHCEQRFTATPPVLAPESVGPVSPADASVASTVPGASSPAPDTSHAMSIFLCSVRPEECPAAEERALAASYRVVFGSGRGVIRTREQAMTDLYRELRDRMGAGEQLVAHPHLRADAGAGDGLGGRPPKATTPSTDALAESALHLLDVVDGAGELTVDVNHASRSGCLLSLASAGGGAAATSRCLIQEPEQLHSHGKGGISF